MAYIRGGQGHIHFGEAQVKLMGPVVVAIPGQQATEQLASVKEQFIAIKHEDEDQLSVEHVFTEKFLRQTCPTSGDAIFAGTDISETGQGIKVDSAKWNGQRVASPLPWRLCITSPMTDKLTEEQVEHFKNIQDQNTTVPLVVHKNMFVLKAIPENACRGNVLAASGAVAVAPETIEAIKRLRSAAGLPELPANPATSTLPEYVFHVSIFQFTPGWLPGMLHALKYCPNAAIAEQMMNAMNDSLKMFWRQFQFSPNQLFINDVQDVVENPVA